MHSISSRWRVAWNQLKELIFKGFSFEKKKKKKKYKTTKKNLAPTWSKHLRIWVSKSSDKDAFKVDSHDN